MQYTMCFLFSFLAFFGYAYSEIEQVIVRWEESLCSSSCQEQLADRLSRLPPVKNIQILPYAQQVVMEWQENQPFLYTPINNALKWVGLSIDEVRLVVNGKITEVPARFSGEPEVTLVSTGDNTPFVLLSPMQPNPEQYTTYFALESHRLTPQMYNQLMAAATKNAEVSIEGPLYAPFRYSVPLYLIIENIQEKKQEEGPPRERPGDSPETY